MKSYIWKDTLEMSYYKSSKMLYLLLASVKNSKISFSLIIFFIETIVDILML